MGKSLRQLEMDIKNTQNDKTTPQNDKFVESMTISFLLLTIENIFYYYRTFGLNFFHIPIY